MGGATAVAEAAFAIMAGEVCASVCGRRKGRQVVERAGQLGRLPRCAVRPGCAAAPPGSPRRCRRLPLAATSPPKGWQAALDAPSEAARVGVVGGMHPGGGPGASHALAELSSCRPGAQRVFAPAVPLVMAAPPPALPEPGLVSAILLDQRAALALGAKLGEALAQGSVHAIELLTAAWAVALRLHAQATLDVVCHRLERAGGEGERQAGGVRARLQAVERDVLEVRRSLRRSLLRCHARRLPLPGTAQRHARRPHVRSPSC